MAEKTFVVENPRTRQRFTIKGKTLKHALKSERLNPGIWKEIHPPEEPEPDTNGEAS